LFRFDHAWAEAVSVTRRDWLAGVAALAATLPSRVLSAAAKTPTLTPERFGAAGDGRTNDTLAFERLTSFVNRQGGGVIVLRPTTYMVGLQSYDRKSGYAYAPASIMDFRGCSGALVIQGNGARLRAANGLRYGTFDPQTGLPTQHPMPYYGSGELSCPYFAMISVAGCAGPVEISDIELDGNLAGLAIGGPWGDTGWQIGCAGLVLRDNAESETVAHVHTHHHAQDGFQISGLVERTASSSFYDCTSEYNVRQGCSLVGGRNYNFDSCRFNHTGKAGLASGPGAGFDIEPEGKSVRGIRFANCEFANNTGCGLAAPFGDAEGTVLESCRLVGTTSWAAWPGHYALHFNNCEFVGSIVATHGDPDPDRAVQFHDCLFRDDPALSPTGEVYDAQNEAPIANIPYAQNVLFNRCRFELTSQTVLPWAGDHPIFSDCVMSQTQTKTAYPRGVYIGTNRIDGNVDLYSSQILGDLTVNGVLVPRTVST